MVARRVFLRNGLGLSGGLLLGCNSDAAWPPLDGASDAGSTPLDCTSAPAPCTYLGALPFVGESEQPLEVPFNVGLDGRLYTDLSTVDPSQPLIDNSRFYVRTRAPSALPSRDDWSVRVTLAGALEREVSIGALLAASRPLGAHVLECSGNGSGASFGLLSSAEWEGVPLLELLDELGAEREGTRVLVSGFDRFETPSANNHSREGASWIFAWSELEATGAFLATRMNGEALPDDHGAPVRLYVPGWYGCTCIKWVNAIALVPDDAAATGQMAEFASRTHQDGVPALARDFQPASMDVAAMPTRIERWRCEGQEALRLFGLVWGQPLDVELEIRIGESAFTPVLRCDDLARVRPWSFWAHQTALPAPGDYAVRLRVPDPQVRTRRLDSGFYERVFRV